MSDEEPCESTFNLSFPVFCEPSGASESCERALGDPSARQDIRPLALSERLTMSPVQSPIFVSARRNFDAE